jgi:hypothetical protein
MFLRYIENHINLSRMGLTGSLWPLMVPPMVSACGSNPGYPGDLLLYGELE